MSYNIDTFKVKKLENLVILVESLYKYGNPEFHPKKRLGEKDESHLKFMWGYSTFIEGPVIDGAIHVKHIDWSGEGSGNDMLEMLEPILKESTGTLIASCVWAGGDSINQLRVEDGKVEWIDIEI